MRNYNLSSKKSSPSLRRKAEGGRRKAEGGKEVYLFGSQAKGTARPGSDIDIAVAGLPPERFFKAMGEIYDVTMQSFDLIDLDEDTPFTRDLKERRKLLRVG